MSRTTTGKRSTLLVLGIAIATLSAWTALAPSEASAQEVAATSRSAGMGDALTAGASGTSSLWHNVAGIASALMYSAEAGYAYAAENAVNALQVHLVDTKSNQYFGAAFSFTYENGGADGQADHVAYHVRGGIAVPLLEGMIKLGTAVRYSSVELDGEEALAAVLVDAGVIVQPLDWLSIGVSGLNLVNGGYSNELPRTIGAGFAFSSLDYGFHIGGDVLFNIESGAPANARTWRAGAEYLIAQLFPVRAGYRYEEALQESTVTVGAGFRDSDSQIGVDASYQHNIDNPAEKTFVGSLSAYF